MDVELDKLSYIDRKMLIFALNKNNAWKELAVTLQFLDCEMNVSKTIKILNYFYFKLIFNTFIEDNNI